MRCGDGQDTLSFSLFDTLRTSTIHGQPRWMNRKEQSRFLSGSQDGLLLSP